jgi:hypothetical protein
MTDRTPVFHLDTLKNFSDLIFFLLAPKPETLWGTPYMAKVLKLYLYLYLFLPSIFRTCDTINIILF